VKKPRRLKVWSRYIIEREGESYVCWWHHSHIDTPQRGGTFKTLEGAQESLWSVPLAIDRRFPDAVEEHGRG
jgi:hypothetical protein